MITKFIREFIGEFRFLSNFYPIEGLRLTAPWLEGYRFQTVEHAYQASKARYTSDIKKIYIAPTPAIAKQIGQTISLRRDWEKVKLDVMTHFLVQKFDFNHPDLKRTLLATHPYILEEGNDWGDTFWGVDLQTKKGNNYLGRLLMRVRDLYREDERGL